MINPAISLLGLSIYSFVLATSTHIYYTHFLIVLLAIFLIKKIYIKEILLLNIFILFIVVPVAFSDTSLATLIFFRSNLIIFLSLSLFYKQDLYKIVKALNILKINKKFIAIVFFAIKSIDMLIKDIKKIDKTLKARGFVAKSDIFTYKTYANMFAIILIKSINKSKQFNKALIARGYKDEIYLIDNSCFSFVDIVFVSVLISSFLNIGVIV